MSLGTSGAITFSGLSSGVDTQSIIQSMMKLAQQPITQLQGQQAAIQTKQAAVQQLVSGLQALSSAAQSLSTQSAFQAVAATSSTPATATVTSTAGAQQGVYSLTVNGLASAQKIASTAQADTTSALNLNGVFVVNGKAVSVSGSDSLTSIAQAINSAGAGVTASLIDGGKGNAYLTLTSNSTGAANGIQFSDVSGNVLSSLGVASGTSAIRQADGNGADSYSFSSASTPIGSMLGLSSGTAGTFSINGTAINVDYASDSLQDVADAINSSGSGATATVVSNTNNGTTSYSLQIEGASSTPTFADPNNLLGAIGVLQSAPGNQLIAASDAKFSLDGVNMTSSTNTVTSAIPGVSLTLLSGSASSPATSTISLQTDTTGITTNVQNFVTAYNQIVGFISQNSQLNTTTFDSGPLFGDFTTQQVQNQLSGMLFNNVPGLSGSFKNLASLGFSLDKSGNLSVDSTTLSNALATNPQAVANVFASSGSSDNSDIQYISSTSKTKATGSAYAVNITQAATRATYAGSTAQTGPSGSGEVLTFSGSMFGSSGYALNIDANSTQQQIIDKINSDSTLKSYVSASSVGGVLTLTSRQYGSSGSFTVSSNQAAAAGNSGIGTNGQGTATAGLDVVGTINGEAATGTGQYLVGNSGNPETDGLQIQYKGTATGAVGSMTFSSGIGSQLQNLITNMTDPTSGFVTQDINSYTSQIDDINTQITNLQTQMTQEQQQLTQEFANMEALIAQYQQQGSALSSFGSSSGSSSSSSSSSNSKINT